MTDESQQVVVYRSCTTDGPRWQFYSMPESIVGGADDLNAAREQYRDALAFSLDVPTNTLPEIRELIEHEASEGTNIWIRGGLNSPTYKTALKFLTAYVQSQPPDHVDWFFEQPAASGDVIIAPVEFDDTLRTITSQMTAFDSVWAVAQGTHSDGSDMLVWLALGGSKAASGGSEQVNLADLGLTPDSPMVDVFTRVITNGERTHSDSRYALATV
ncbi:hypothetical protein GOEFS_036_01220 [Gordonia effusa NBRC 100432]|uniref:Uncharacterized protein n=1 Tax=Gordonia effusa NBRC 100432 TaxID=1077974 RepID=H0QXY2_9ACTN|nr:hypothetical protein [Gordonia effusa]GAB17683.1 hypothetical protein GOEFS_036_01220 [Gordonia effusa NBRC 100432]